MAKRSNKGLRKARCVRTKMKNGASKANARRACKVKGASKRRR